ncbi:hypothetical protein SBOR_1160 [Sclerotinia borealis F-4128]|uniref:Uncharacterized protein n=1 Tax=Sclerotinia borealis (strain F-4128) TaxID=1432307 RepID=W9CQZ5_SCLBF|nr:hypothetical protein SBOR_1160 [Sclerotinia borealis F-4128]
MLEWAAFSNLILAAKTKDLGFGECAPGCYLNSEGQKHPIVVVQIDGSTISYVQMTAKQMESDEETGTLYSPIKHYFTTPKEDKKLRKLASTPVRSNYFLRALQWEKDTINNVRNKIFGHPNLELEKYSELRLPHVYELPLKRFKPFGGSEARAIDHRLDEGSYYRLMDRLGLEASRYPTDAELLGLPEKCCNTQVTNASTPQHHPPQSREISTGTLPDSAKARRAAAKRAKRTRPISAPIKLTASMCLESTDDL